MDYKKVTDFKSLSQYSVVLTVMCNYPVTYLFSTVHVNSRYNSYPLGLHQWNEVSLSPHLNKINSLVQ